MPPATRSRSWTLFGAGPAALAVGSALAVLYAPPAGVAVISGLFLEALAARTTLTFGPCAFTCAIAHRRVTHLGFRPRCRDLRALHECLGLGGVMVARQARNTGGRRGLTARLSRPSIGRRARPRGRDVTGA